MINIEDAASTIRRHQQDPPVNLERLAYDLGSGVTRVELPASRAGQIVSQEFPPLRSGYAIQINRSLGRRQSRYALAHLLAHLVLHRSHLGSGIEEDMELRSNSLSERFEAQADNLAADLLIPPMVVKKWTREENRSHQEVAQLLDVSERAVSAYLEQV